MQRFGHRQCPNCGAILTPSVDVKYITCEYCGTQFYVEQEEKVEQPPVEAPQFVPTYKNKKYVAICFAVIVPLIIIAIIINIAIVFGQDWDIALADDKFDNCTVTFSGLSGKGKATVTGVEDSYVDIQNNGHLSNGDTVTIRIGSSSKEFVVEGLDEYVHDPNTLSDEALAKLEEISSAVNDKNLNDKWYRTVTPKDTVGEPVRIAIHAVYNDNYSVLYDVYKVDWHSNSGNDYQVYIAVYYKFPIIRNNPVSLSYAEHMYTGHYMVTSDKGEDMWTALSGRSIEGWWSYEELVNDLLYTQSEPMTVVSRTFD